MALVTLTTDFGTRDGYVGAMKGVILGDAPGTTVVDITHDIPPQDVEAGAWCVASFWRYFPEGTVHVAVVDPGVGTDRAGLIARADGRFLIGPDNGVFSEAFRKAQSLEVRLIRSDIHLPAGLSATFHGRDVFAHAAALISAGKRDWMQLTDPVESYTLLTHAEADYQKEMITGSVLHVDRYGNLITNISGKRLTADEEWMIRLGGADIAIRALSRTYGDVEPGTPLALVGSSGLLEIAVCRGSAYSLFRTDPGAPIRIHRLNQ